MSATQHLSGPPLDTIPVASVPAPRVPGHDKLVIEHLHEFAVSSVMSLTVSISDSLSCLPH